MNTYAIIAILAFSGIVAAVSYIFERLIDRKTVSRRSNGNV